MTTQGRVAVSIAASLFLIFGLLAAFALLGGAPDLRECATQAKPEQSEASLAQGKEKRPPHQNLWVNLGSGRAPRLW